MPAKLDPRTLSYVHKASDYDPSQAVFLECWEPWCGPCKASIPHVAEMAKRYRNVYFVGISGDSPAKLAAFVEQNPVMKAYNVASGGDAVKSRFGVSGVPHAFLFAPDGEALFDGHPTDAGCEKALAAANAQYVRSTAGEWTGKARRL